MQIVQSLAGFTLGRSDLLRRAMSKKKLEVMEKDMMAQEGVTEALKAADQMEWVRRCNSIRSRAEEVILRELVYA